MSVNEMYKTNNYKMAKIRLPGSYNNQFRNSSILDIIVKKGLISNNARTTLSTDRENLAT